MGASHVQLGLRCIFSIGFALLVRCQLGHLPVERTSAATLQYVCGHNENETTTVIHSLDSSWIGTKVKVLCQNGYIHLPVESNANIMYMYFPQGFYFDVDASPCIFRGPFDVPGNISVESYHALVSYTYNEKDKMSCSVECFLPKRPEVLSFERHRRNPASARELPDTTAAYTTPEVTATAPAFSSSRPAGGGSMSSRRISSTTTPRPRVHVPGTGVYVPGPGVPSDEVPACALDTNSDYIVKVVPHCGSVTDDDDPYIEIITDLPLTAHARCYGGHLYDFSTSDNVNLHLANSFDEGDADRMCVFRKTDNSAVYTILIQVAINKVHACKKDFQVTCTFDMYARGRSSPSSAAVTLIAAKEIQSNQGEDSQSTIEVQVVDVLDIPILGPLPLRRKVQLQAEASGTATELGLKPVSCDAVGVQFGRRYAILRAGCGDGLIFAQSEGFTTNGLRSVSPYFKAFKLAGDAQLRFECNFTMCPGLCDGSSCVHHRRKRSLDYEPFRVEAPTVKGLGSRTRSESFVIILFALSSIVLILSHVTVLYKGICCRK